MNGFTSTETDPDCSEFVEVDPTGRYGRYNEILGKGASKIVYRAFDEYEGIEVAWNQVKLCDFLQSPDDLERLYCEIHLLKTLNHKNIMKFYTSWVDTANRNINFVTEMFTSGTLRQYRLKHRKVHIRAVKHWCRQILLGLNYLHSRNPPVIHRDLKCDNIFVNGNQGEVKIGDLGLAAILRKSHAARVVGTPEFMAPEVYEEEYNELVDIYSFGMCILEMVTFEYPYSECNHPAQIYKKVISGQKPEALYKVKDPEVRAFIEKCLATVSSRLSARELLKDPFLQIDDYDYYQCDYDEVGPLIRQPFYGIQRNLNSWSNAYSDYVGYHHEDDLERHLLNEHQPSEIDLFTCHEDDDEHLADFEISIKGKKKDDDGIFLRLRIADKEGRIRNIYFPFDITMDTAMSVATEMVAELDITDQDVTKIADMIDGEIATLVPGWKKGVAIEETPNNNSTTGFCHSCAPNCHLGDYAPADSTHEPKNLQVLQCSKHGCTAIHGRFEEITYQVDGVEEPKCSDIHHADIWAQREGPREIIQCNEVHDKEEERIINVDGQSEFTATENCSQLDGCENEIRQELRWLKAKYEKQLREVRNKQLRGRHSKSPSLVLFPDEKDKGRTKDVNWSCNKTESMATAKSFYSGGLLPPSLHRATSLPVDAIDF